MRHQWNTGRQYDETGQRIVAEVTEKGIRFSDLSRGIDGLILLGAHKQGNSLDKYEIEALVMSNYDHGNYSSTSTTLNWEGHLISR